MKELLFIVGTHGNELAPLKLFYDHPYGQTDEVRWEVMVGNPGAVLENTRFVEDDLNRSFGKEDYGNLHEYTKYLVDRIHGRIAKKHYDILYDVHTSNDIKPLSFPDCAFINNVDDKTLQAVKNLTVEHIIWDSNPEYNGQYVTSAHPVGVTLEYQKTARFEYDVKKVLVNFENVVYQRIPQRKKYLYEADKPITQLERDRYDLQLEDFKPLTSEQNILLQLPPDEVYVPVFVNKKEIDPNYYCFLNKKLREL